MERSRANRTVISSSPAPRIVATVLGFFYIGLSVRFAQERSTATARRLFGFSIIYLTLLLGALVANRIWL